MWLYARDPGGTSQGEGFSAGQRSPPLPREGPPPPHVCLMASPLPARQGPRWGTRWREPCAPSRRPWRGTATPSCAWASTGARTAPRCCTSSTRPCRGEPHCGGAQTPRPPPAPPPRAPPGKRGGRRRAAWDRGRCCDFLVRSPAFLEHLTCAWPWVWVCKPPCLTAGRGAGMGGSRSCWGGEIYQAGMCAQI